MGGLIFIIIIGILIYNVVVKGNKINTNTPNYNLPRNNNSLNNSLDNNLINNMQNEIDKKVEKEVEKRLQKEIKDVENIYKDKYEKILKEEIKKINRTKQSKEEILDMNVIKENIIKFTKYINENKNKINISYIEKINLEEFIKTLSENFDINFYKKEIKEEENIEKIYENIYENVNKNIDKFIEAGYFYKRNNEKNIKKAFDNFYIAAIFGNEESAYNIAMMYKDGEIGEIDYEKAAYFMKLSAEAGYVYAENEYGIMLATGEGVSQDLYKASNYFLSASKKGNKAAKENMKILKQYIK